MRMNVAIKVVVLAVASMVLGFQFSFCNSASAQRPKTPTVLSVGEIVGNYGLDTNWVNDTAGAMAYLESQPEDYVALTNLCVSIRTKAQKMIASIENDYDFRDSLVWIDSNTVLGDYQIYEFRLRRLADLMGRMSIKYSRLEQQRIEAEKENARRRAIEEARRQQEERNRMAADLRSSIDLHHRAIITACDGAGVSDKAKLKELKDLYYSYLMVYNKYDLSVGNATGESINRLDELNSFQNDLLENVLGQNSLPSQIENFKNILKVRCETENSDVYRSYCKVFKQTSVPVSFADVREYENYVNRMRVVVNVQQRYLQTLDLRATIAAASDAIVAQYGKKYKQIVSAYREVLRTVNLLPAFTTNAESILFIRNMEDFIAAQQLWLDYYSLLEQIGQRSDSIKSVGVKLADIASAYREVEPSMLPVPGFRDTEGALQYEAQLEVVRQVQECYLEVIERRKAIARNDDTLTSSRRLGRILSNGYRILRKQTDLRPSFSTVDRGQAFLKTLSAYSEMQETCLEIRAKLRKIEENEHVITAKDNPYRNISKAYKRMEKVYGGISEITNKDELRRYNRQCDNLLAMQQVFIAAIHSEMAVNKDNMLKHETEIEKIKLVIGMK